MTTGATGQLGLALPVQGELSGTWGDTVNNGITQYTNIAIAATLTLTNDGAVTLANTTGDASASNIVSTLTGAGTVTAQFAIVRVTGTLTVAKVVTAPSYSKTYTVVNAATGGIVTFKAAGQTGVSIAVGESAFVYYNGTDYVKVATSTAGTGSVTSVGGTGTVNGISLSGTVTTSGSLTLGGTLSLVSPPAIGSTTPNTGAFTTLSASGATTLSAQLIASTGDGSYPMVSRDTSAFSAGVSGSKIGFFGLDSTSTNTALGAISTLAQTGQNATLRAQVLDSGSLATIGTFSTTGLTIAGSTTSNSFIPSSATVPTNGMYLPSANNVAFAINSSEAMRLTSTGLGIGTSSPTVKLDITGYETRLLAPASGKSINFYADAAGSAIGYLSAGFLGFGKTTSTISTQFTEQMRLTSAGGLVVGTTTDPGAGIIADANGNVRTVPQSGSSKTSSYTLATTDIGEYILLGASGAIVIPDATFAAGDVITIFNNTASTATITCSITTAYIAGTFTDKATMTLAAAGVATVLFITSTLCVVSGNVT